MGASGGIRGNVYVLGAVSFLTDVSSEMIFPVLPVFLTTFLGVKQEILGLIEGVADSLSGLLDIVFGYWSDTSANRKRFVLLGYGLSSLSKVGIALATVWPVVLVFRGLDRIGKSVRTSPRDAIIAASSGREVRGKAFGLHRMLDTLGAIAGPVLAYLILAWLGSGEGAYRGVFYAALIPAFLAVLVIVLFVREPKGAKEEMEEKAPRPNFWQSLRILSGDYKRFLLISVFFSLAYFSFALLILRASEIGVSAQDILIAYIIYNVVYAAASIPVGQLSDKVGRKPVIAAAFLLYGVVAVGFALASSFLEIALLFAVYGVFVAADESVNKAYISDIVGEKNRGMALGAYNSAVSAAYLPANAAFGVLWAAFGAIPAFGAAAGIAVVSGAAMLFYSK